MPPKDNDSGSEVHASDPDRVPDAAFEAGRPHHLVAGNEGRLLDRRRTPVRVRGLEVESGLAFIEVTGFEDTGAVWEVPFEDVGRFQFRRRGERATGRALEEVQAAITRFDRPLRIDTDPAARRRTSADIGRARARAETFLAERGSIPKPVALDTLRRDYLDDVQLAFADFMAGEGAQLVEDSFIAAFVSNPHASEGVRAHRIVLAELGLVPYEGNVLRRARELEGTGDRARRRQHIVARMGFLRALFDRTGLLRIELFRGLALEGALERSRPRTFVSTTFDRTVAESFFGRAGDGAEVALLCRQKVPVERLFATHLETRAMNAGPFRESEAVVLSDPGNAAF